MTEQIVNFERMEYALTLFGNSDENIRMLEQGYGVSVVFRGTDIKVSGDAEKVMTCTRCIEGLLKMVESGEELSAQNIRYMMSLVEEGREQEAETLGKDVICIPAKGKPLKPKTLGQQKYVEAIRKNTITMGIGPAGTGKTYLAVAAAVAAFRERKINRIILTRPAVEAGASASCRAICRARSTRTCARCTTRSSTCSARRRTRSIWSAVTSRSRRSPICAAARSTTASSFSTRRRTPPASR